MLKKIDSLYWRRVKNKKQGIINRTALVGIVGGPDPLDGISIYDGGDYWHFVTYGLSDLYEKTNNESEYSGYGIEFTLKLKKGIYDVEKEIKNLCGVLQQIARVTFTNNEIFQPNEFLYTGQTVGMDSEKNLI